MRKKFLRLHYSIELREQQIFDKFENDDQEIIIKFQENTIELKKFWNFGKMDTGLTFLQRL